MSPFPSNHYLVIARTSEFKCIPVFITADRAAADEVAMKLTHVGANSAAHVIGARSGELLNVQIIEFQNGRPAAVEFVTLRSVLSPSVKAALLEGQKPIDDAGEVAGDKPT